MSRPRRRAAPASFDTQLEGEDSHAGPPRRRRRSSRRRLPTGDDATPAVPQLPATAPPIPVHCSDYVPAPGPSVAEIADAVIRRLQETGQSPPTIPTPVNLLPPSASQPDSSGTAASVLIPTSTTGSAVVVLLGLISVGASMKCFTCDRAAHPRDCPFVAECGPHEVCYVQKLITLDGHTLFNTGCKDKQFCYGNGKRALQNEARNIKPRQTLGQERPICDTCCDTDHCNYGGCGEPPLPPRSQRGPICLHCKQQQTDSSCNEVAVCGQDQLCGISTAYDVIYDHVFNSFCAPKAFCSQASFIGKRQTNHYCVLCCADDMCNSNCSLPKISTTTSTHATTTTRSSTTATTTTTTTTTPPTTSTTPTTTTPTTTTPTTTTPTTTTPTTTTPTTTTSTTTSTTTPPPSCSPTEIRYGQSCYYFSLEYKYWSESLAICKQKGGTLVKIDSQSENDFVVSQLRLMKANGEIPDTIWGYYIGAHLDKSVNVKGEWKWSDGSPLSYMAWSHGEPDHSASQIYAMIILPGHYQGDYGWASNDDIDGAERFICEIPLH